MTAPAPQCQPMPADLRQRLRAMPSSLNDACRTMEEAADQIEKLEGALRNSCARVQDFLSTFGDLGDCVTAADLNDWFAALEAKPAGETGNE